jgi:hypothetical protein
MARTVISSAKKASVVTTSASVSDSSLKEYLEVVFTKDDGTTSTVNVYDGNYYTIKFYCDGSFKTVIAKIIKVYELFIYIQYVDMPDAANNCKCIPKNYVMLNAAGVTKSVMLSDIYSIEEYVEEEETEQVEEPKPVQVKEVTKVSVLGISAEFIHSIVVRLRVYDDGSCCDVTDCTVVDMKVGGRYNVSYLDHHDHSMYEIDGVLKSISIEQNFGDEDPNHGFVRNECECHDHNYVGMNNMTYDSTEMDDETIYDADHFMSLAKDSGNRVLFVFDTSEFTESSFDRVWLTDIRSVKVIEDSDIEITEEEMNNVVNSNICADTDCCCNVTTSTSSVPLHQMYTPIPMPITPVEYVMPNEKVEDYFVTDNTSEVGYPIIPDTTEVTDNGNGSITIGDYNFYLGASNSDMKITVEDARTGNLMSYDIKDFMKLYVEKMEK